MTRLYLVRHGETTDAKACKIIGQMDVDLSPEGERQMYILAKRLLDVQFMGIYASDLIRSIRSAEAIARGRNLNPLYCKELREMGFGNWEGLTFSELMERFPEELKSRINDPVHFSPPGGESINDLRKRVIPKFNELIKRHRGESFCIVGHGGVNRIILLEALGADLYNFYRIEQDFACVNIVDFHPDGRIVVKLVNGTYSN